MMISRRAGVSVALLTGLALTLSGCASSGVSTSSTAYAENITPIQNTPVASSNLPAIGANGQPVAVSGASQTFGTPAANALDRNPQTGWNINGGQGRAHAAVFRLAEPAQGEELSLSLIFERYYAPALGRFRISVTTDPRGAEARHPAEIEEILATAADSRTVLVRVLGTLAGLIGAGLAVLGGWLSATQTTLPLVLAAVGGVLAGVGFAGLVRGWELKVLTPAGSAAWLQTESLRQFLAQSPPTAIDEAVADGRLGTYTAWALALGQAKRWKELATTTTVPGRRGYYSDPYYRYAVHSPVFVHSCSTASTAPSSSSSGGGGGGVGGGAGGGGGGSW